ncbi:MAG: rRNA maturation RNase YbeY [endosymbiont of Galathealinum brachiosum]|uniref:Endoribonuclease YbeY n=1 Tax=endosymbiont of Galathealinum brachiosum TaxID=2200906 RepID=A0A370DJ81_9GAMM|nr:MAG: rRNA maturation RNase YbeY [endosymbiont of Galathealinum brachiosum]
MAIQMDVQFAEDLPETIEEPPSRSLLCSWAQAAWQGDESAEPVLSLRIVNLSESQQLNNDYRNKNKPTNVLSFPMQMESGFDESLMLSTMLGDLAICAEIVEKEADEQKKTLQEHWAHMVVHGMLHLQGFDHIEDEGALQMESLETQIMQQLGFSDPYLFNNPEKTSVTELKS